MSPALVAVDAVAGRVNPDPAEAPTSRIEAGTELRELERLGDWVRVETPSGDRWWVDGRRLSAAPPGRSPAVVAAPQPVPPPPSPAADASADFARGLALVERGEPAEAVEAFSQLIRKDPANSGAYVNRASCYLLMGGQEEAVVRDCTEAIRLDPGNELAHANRGLARCFLGDLQGALEDCNQAIRLGADFTGYLHRGITYLNLGQPQDAVSDLTHALERNRSDPDTYVSRGRAYAALQQYAPAVSDFSRALDLDPANSEARRQRGLALMMSGSVKKGLRDLDQAIRLDPADALAYYLRGSGYLDRGETRRAVDDFDRAIQLDPGNPAFYASRGACLRDLDEPQRALEDYDSAIGLARSQPSSHVDLAEVLVNRAVAFTDMGDTPRAFANCNDAIQIDPHHGFAYYVRGINSAMQGDSAAAIADFRRVLESDQEHLHADAAARVRELTG